MSQWELGLRRNCNPLQSLSNTAVAMSRQHNVFPSKVGKTGERMVQIVTFNGPAWVSDETIFRILAENHYRGWVSIEDGMNGMEEMAESLAFLRKMSDRYFN